jgi:NAD(P)-dependent dehydrogenase (short-subunit alcohol dehydrogenase family)
MENLKDKIAVVTGGNSGIGYATAKELKLQGATVIITGRRADAVNKAAQELGVDGFVANQADLVATSSLVKDVEHKYGKVDILFINAGVVGLSTIEDATETHFDEIFDVNFKGAFFTLSKFIPLLNDGSSVVFLSSNTASKAMAGSSVYASSKTALNAVMRAAALELAPRKIRVNSVSPGPTVTEIMNKAGLDEQTLNTIKENLVERIPLKKMGSADDVAKFVAYLCGDQSSFITGSETVMDGGMILL